MNKQKALRLFRTIELAVKSETKKRPNKRFKLALEYYNGKYTITLVAMHRVLEDTTDYQAQYSGDGCSNHFSDSTSAKIFVNNYYTFLLRVEEILAL